ncbi:UNVERIFIED_CONTAM: hypothetical protein PYX00_007838 [Menopon gallinae]|uniref:U3 small nucleolar RNA-associated protein 25 homolog n=1 Tax=Menopon gallinae TaxID=328185 RepID=A0AAW2HLC9_9NEOP
MARLNRKKSGKAKPLKKNSKKFNTRHKNKKNWKKTKRNSSNHVIREQVENKPTEDETSEPANVCEVVPPPLQLLLSTFTPSKGKTSRALTSRSEPEISDDTSSGVHKRAKRENSNDIPSNTSNNTRSESVDNEEEDNKDSDEEIDCHMVEETVNDKLDPFTCHFNYDLSTSIVDALTSSPPRIKTMDLYWPNLHNLKIELLTPEESMDNQTAATAIIDGEKEYAKLIGPPNLEKKLNWNQLYVKSQIQSNIRKANKSQLDNCDSEDLTDLQKEIFTIINSYQDLFFYERSFSNSEEVRFAYCLHVVNHILKTRLKILHHNEKIMKKSDVQVPDEYRDQGLVRPKVVILVPFKESCFRIVNMISDILIAEDRGNVINKSRFIEEFSGSELIIPKKNAKPEDYEHLFKGNIDDKFKIGISFTKKSLKLYADFYSSDVIIASPLGLRLVVGAEGDRKRDFDFLASVEVLIMDQAEVFLMQNWDHLLLILDHLHIQPKESHGTDFSRIRSWVLNGWSKFYRQTLIFSSIITPELNAVFSRRCHNYAGKIRIVNPVESGSISLVVAQVSHVFQKFKADSALSACEARFKFFTEVLQQYKDPSFTGICEYSKDERIARARDKFFHNEARFLLYSERFHFFRRIKLKGIQHIIFYQLPTFPHFYSELCNFMKVAESTNQRPTNNSIASVSVLYCKYDLHQLSAVVRTSRATKLLQSEKDVHMFTTG